MMVLIKNKRLFIFILFTLVLFVTSFKKLVETSSQYRDIPLEYYIDEVKIKGNATKPICLSVNCNRPVNINFNEQSGGNTYDTGGDLAAYCCKACRNSGGVGNHDGDCLINGGSCNNTSIVEGMNDKCDGIIDNGKNMCYSKDENGEMSTTPIASDPTSAEACGPSSFYKCFQDPDCANYMNNINMSSYEYDEPQKDEKWESNITNMLNFSYFNDFNDATDKDGVKGRKLDGNFCNELCIKANDEPPDKDVDENGYKMWHELNLRMSNKDDKIAARAICEKSNAVWRSKMLCNGCRMLDVDKNGCKALTNDPNYRKLSCHADSSYNNTKEIQDKQSIIVTETNGATNFARFIRSKDKDTNIYADLELVDDDITTAANILYNKGWPSDGSRTINDIEFGCRLNCAYDMHDNCFGNEPNYDEINTIKNQCRAACDKRLPAWAYYGNKIGNADEAMGDTNGWLNTDTAPPKKWSEWSNIFSPDE